jgi:oligosaccharide repeat unit polymerase
VVIFALFLLLGIAALWVSKLLWQDYFTPWGLFLFFWFFALAFFNLDLVVYHPLSPATQAVIGWSMACFFLAALAPTLLLLRPQRVARPIQWDAPTRRLRFERGLMLLFVLGVFGFLLQLLHLQREVGLATFLSDPQRMREMHTNIKYLGFLNLLNVVNLVLVVQYFSLCSRPSKAMAGILVWSLLTLLLTTDRTRFFYALIWSFYVFAYSQKHFRLKPSIVAGGSMLVAVLMGFFILVGSVYKKQVYEQNAQFIHVGPQFAALVDPYVYLTGSFPVLDAFLQDPTHTDPLWGKHTFEPLVKSMELIYPDLQRADLVGQFYQVPWDLNVGTFLQPFYLDWGPSGLYVMPWLLGFGCGLAYVALRRQRSGFSIYLNGLLGFCITISIFVNHFTQTATIFFVLIGWLFFQYVSHEPTKGPGFQPLRERHHSPDQTPPIASASPLE